MKTLLLSLLSVFVLMASCKKGRLEETPLYDEFHDVKFDISLSDRNLLDSSSLNNVSAADTRFTGKLSDYFQKLEYYLYNSKGIKITQLSIDADNSATGFQIPAARLNPGKYTVVFLGRKEKSTGTSSAIYYGDNQSTPYLAHSLQREVTDLFYTSQEFEVKENNTHIPVSLKRPGGKVKIIIDDEWPAEVERIAMLVNGFTLFYPKSDNLAERKDLTLPVFKNYISSLILENGVNVPKETYVDCSYENFVFTNSSNVTMITATVIAYGRLNTMLSRKILKDIKVERNKITTVKVKLFN